MKYVYCLARIGPFVVHLFSDKERKAADLESNLHRQLGRFRFTQSRWRSVGKMVLQVGYVWLCYYVLTDHFEPIRPEEIENLLWCFLGAYTCLFWAEIKVGISNNPKRRAREVGEDLSSGKTEWFKAPIWLALPLVLWVLIWVRPIAGFAVLTACFTALFFVFLG